MSQQHATCCSFCLMPSAWFPLCQGFHKAFYYLSWCQQSSIIFSKRTSLPLRVSQTFSSIPSYYVIIVALSLWNSVDTKFFVAMNSFFDSLDIVTELRTVKDSEQRLNKFLLIYQKKLWLGQCKKKKKWWKGSSIQVSLRYRKVGCLLEITAGRYDVDCL